SRSRAEEEVAIAVRPATFPSSRCSHSAASPDSSSLVEGLGELETIGDDDPLRPVHEGLAEVVIEEDGLATDEAGAFRDQHLRFVRAHREGTPRCLALAPDTVLDPRSRHEHSPAPCRLETEIERVDRS